MTTSVRVAPPNSLLGISDAQKGEVPDLDSESNISATASCILIACLPEVDGETEITLGAAHQVDPGGAAAFDGQLETPSGDLQVVTIEWQPLLKAAVTRGKTRIRIWQNRSKFPDKLIIGIG